MHFSRTLLLGWTRSFQECWRQMLGFGVVILPHEVLSGCLQTCPRSQQGVKQAGLRGKDRALSRENPPKPSPSECVGRDQIIGMATRSL